MIDKWTYRFLELAQLVSTWSKDPSSQIGSVISRGKEVISIGFNGLPKGISQEEEILNNREEKYETILHAEINSILWAKRDIQGCTMTTYPIMPCSRCASVLIQSGITRVVAPPNFPERWKASFDRSKRLFSMANVELVLVEDEQDVLTRLAWPE
ncbi:MAG: deoxycytidylate deaminase [Nitrososphaerales archaeon]